MRRKIYAWIESKADRECQEAKSARSVSTGLLLGKAFRARYPAPCPLIGIARLKRSLRPKQKRDQRSRPKDSILTPNLGSESVGFLRTLRKVNTAFRTQGLTRFGITGRVRMISLGGYEERKEAEDDDGG